MVLGAALLGSAQACGCAANRGQHHNDRHVMRDGGKHHHHHDRRAHRRGYGWITGAGNHTAAPKNEVTPSVHKPQAPQAPQAHRRYKMNWGKQQPAAK